MQGIAKEDKAGPSSPMKEEGGTGFEFDVFLSFRGPDTRGRFTRHLYEKLKNSGFHTFMDEENLHKGENISKLLRYVERSQIFVLILSENYATSKWCLLEAAKMVQIREADKNCRHIVPVFFDVDPSDLKDGRGRFQIDAANLRKQGKLNKEEVKECNDALRTLASICGFSLKNGANGDEAKLCTMICQRVSSILKMTPFGIQPIGIDPQINEVMNMLEDKPNGISIVGICGQGGIGKTTIAMAIFNKLSHEFTSTSFISDVREEAKRHKGLPSLQAKLISDITKEQNVSVDMVDNGLSMIGQKLGRKKVLMVLDDVDEPKHLDALIGDKANVKPEHLFGAGSKIIVTTRNKAALTAHGLKIFEPKELKHADSLRLFRLHAFKVSLPPTLEFLELSESVVKVAGGLPLTLKTFGSHFASVKRDRHRWEVEFELLQKNSHKDVLERLKISYDGLERSQKHVFLDIACFLIGSTTGQALYMWEDRYRYAAESAIDVLKSKSLISVDADNKFRMHDEIRDMGRWIVKELKGKGKPHKYSRLWDRDDIYEILQDAKENRVVEGIVLNTEEGCDLELSTTAFKEMSNLRLLRLNFVSFQEFDTAQFPRKLKWLEWRGCELETLFFDCMFQNLVILNLSQSNVREIQWGRKNFLRLKVLDLSHCCYLEHTPKFDCILRVEKLLLDGCGALEMVDMSICRLSNLTILSMRGCTSLKELPNNRELKQEGQSSMSNLSKLEELNLQGCEQLQSLPQLPQSLKRLLLQGCKMLKDVSGLQQGQNSTLSKLEEVSLQGCERLQSLPRLPSSLKKLLLQGCNMLKDIHELENLEEIELLKMDGCERINRTLMMRLFQGTSFTHLEELSVSASKTMCLGEKFFFVVPFCSPSSPLLLEPLQCYGEGTKSDSIYMKICVKDMHDNQVIYQTILSAYRDIYNEIDDDLWGWCYTVSFSEYDDMNISPYIYKPCLVWISRTDDLALKKVDILLRTAEKWSRNYSTVTPIEENLATFVKAQSELVKCRTLQFFVLFVYAEEDIDTSFIENLYKSLEQHGITIFKSKDVASMGEKDESLLKCVERSHICIPIFSEHFSQSRERLNSVAKMIESRKLILPIYTDVHPLDARCQIQDFERHFSIHKNEDQSESVEYWRKELEVVFRQCHHQLIYEPSRYMEELITVIRDRISSLRNSIGFRVWSTIIGELNIHQQNIFLDIACCLVGREKEYATYMWEDSGYSPTDAIKVLQDRSLISVDEEDMLKMDDYIRDMGRWIVKEGILNPCKYARLWDDKDLLDRLSLGDHEEYWTNHQIEGIALVDGCPRPIWIEAINLRVLHLTNCQGFTYKCLQSLKSLRWLRMESCAMDTQLLGIEDIPENLVVLQLHHCPTRIKRVSKMHYSPTWIRRTVSKHNVWKKLKVLEIILGHSNHDGIEVLDFSLMPSLVKLVIEGCDTLTISDIKSIGNLQNLECLRIRKCRSLKKLPSSIGNLRSLQILDLEGRSLSKLPRGLGDLIALKKLILHDCRALRKIPNSITKLNHLEALEVRGCPRLQHIPQLPCSLQTLELQDCDRLSIVPQRLWGLITRKKLTFHCCGLLIVIPILIIKRNCLEALEMRGWHKLQRLLQFLCAVIFDIQNCYMLSELPKGLGDLIALKKLILHYCGSLMEIPNSLVKLNHLETLEMRGWQRLQHLPQLPCSLQILDLEGCCMLLELPEGLGDLIALKMLMLHDCGSLMEIPNSIIKLNQLETLEMRGCNRLQHLPQLPRSLQTLVLERCHMLSEFPEGLEDLIALKKLVLQTCLSLKEIPQLPSSLITLDASTCDNLRKITDISSMQCLKTLNLRGCKELEFVPGLQHLTSLQSLKLPFHLER